MRQTRLQIARADIVKFLDESRAHVLTPRDLDRILVLQRQFWRLAQRTTTSEFIAFLQKTGNLRSIEFKFPRQRYIRHIWREAPTLEVVTSLRSGSYISHFTAMKAHGLTDQIPKTIYVNQEQPGHSNSDSKLKQASIDFAFRRPQRVSNNVADLGEYRVCLISGQNTGNLGVVTMRVPDIHVSLEANILITDLERTLIDIAVRPAYAGGVSEVLAAYRAAAARVSVNRLSALVKKLEYVYPYFQTIGFYLDRAGTYKPSAVDLFREQDKQYDFYLTHGMVDMDYVSEWRLFIPKGF